METTIDAFLAITQTSDAPTAEPHHSEDHHGKPKLIIEKDIFIEKKFSDVKENFKSLNQILFEQPEVPFYFQKSTLCIFRFEDVLLNLYPHFASMRRKGMTVREIYLKNDPGKESFVGGS
jgi:hypothetical protein